MAVSASDRKLYLMAASRSEAGKKSLKKFDAELKKQSSAKAKRDADFQLHTGSTPKQSAARARRNADFKLHTGSTPSKKLATRSPKAPARKNSTTETQEKLIERGYDLGGSGADGIAGAKTRAAVMAFQRKNGLTVDGIVGPQTLAALNGKTASEATEALQDEAGDVEAAEVRRDRAMDHVSGPNADARDEVRVIRASGRVAEEKRDLHDASVDQYEAYDNHTGSSADSYDQADEDADISSAHDAVREQAREEVVTSIAESPHQANARLDYATMELDESTTAVDESQLPSAFDYAMLDEGPALVDQRLQLESERDKDRERFVAVAGNEAIYSARRNEDIETDIYTETRGSQIERAAASGVSGTTLDDIEGLTGDALVEAREADPENRNEENSQLTADIYDTVNLAAIRNILAAPGDPAQTGNVVNTDLLVDAQVEDIANGVRDADPETAEAFETLIASQGLAHEFDVSVSGVSTQASGSALATGSGDADIRHAVMLREPGAILGELADYHSGRLEADSLAVQGNYRFDRILATDDRFAELDAQLTAGVSEDGSSFEPYAPSVYATAGHMLQGSIDADMSLNEWGLQRPEFTVPDDELDRYTSPGSPGDTDAGGAAPTRPVLINGQVVEITEQQFNELAEQYNYKPPDDAETHTVNRTMLRYHTRQIGIYEQRREELAPEIERLRNIDNPDVLEAQRLDELEALDAELAAFQSGSHNTKLLLGHAISAHIQQQRLDGYASEASAVDQSFEILEGWEDGEFEARLTMPRLIGDKPQYLSLENGNGELYNPAAGLYFDFEASGDGVWIYRGDAFDDHKHTYQARTTSHGYETTAVTTEFGFSNIKIRRNDDGTYTLSYDVNSDAGTTHVEGALGAADIRMWNQVLEVDRVSNEETATLTRLNAVRPELTQTWRDRVNSDDFRDRLPANADERPVLEATKALEEAERVYLDDPNNENLERLNDASLDWSRVHADYANEQAADEYETAVAAYERGVQNHVPPDVRRALYAKKIEAEKKRDETALAESGSDLAYDLRDGDSQARRTALFMKDAEQYSQSAFDGFAQESDPIDVAKGGGAYDYAAQQIAGVENFDDLDPDQQEMVGKIAGEIADVTDDNGGSVQAFPILREQEVDGKTQLVMDIMFRVTNENGGSRLIDVDGRSYADESDFRNNNKSIQAQGETLLVMPEEGKITRDDSGHVRLSVGDGRIESGWEEFRRQYHVDTVVGGIGIAAGVALMATGVGSPLGVALLAVSAGSMAYGATTAGLDSYDRVTHGEDWFSSSNLMNYGTIAASVLPGGKLVQQGRVGIGATRSTLGSGLALQRGNRVMALTGRNFTGSASDDFVRVANGSWDDATRSIVGNGLGSQLIEVTGKTGGVIGTGMTGVDTAVLAHQLDKYGMEDASALDIGMTLADLGAEISGATVGLRSSGRGGQQGNRQAGAAQPDPVAAPPQPQSAAAPSYPALPPGPRLPELTTGALQTEPGANASFPELTAGPIRPALLAGDTPATGPDGTRIDGSAQAPQSAAQEQMREVLNRAVPTFKKEGDHPEQLIAHLDDGSRVLLRKDFGDRSHGSPDHYNIEVQNEKGRTVENYHLFVNEDGDINRILDRKMNPRPDPVRAAQMQEWGADPDHPAPEGRADGSGDPDLPNEMDGGAGGPAASGPLQLPPGPIYRQLPAGDPDWRNRIGQANPMNSFLTAEEIENSFFSKHYTAGTITNGHIHDGFIRASLERTADHPEIGRVSDTLGYLKEFKLERFDTVVENTWSNVEERKAGSTERWFDAPPEGIDAEKWNELTDTEKAGFAFTAEIERAVDQEYEQSRDSVLEELDGYIALSEKNALTSDRRRASKVYEEFRQQTGGDNLPATLSEFLNGVKQKIGADEVTTEGLDFMRELSPLMTRLRTKTGIPRRDRRGSQFLTSGLGAAVTMPLNSPELRALLQGGSAITRGGYGVARTVSERAKARQDVWFAASYGAGIPSGVAATVTAEARVDAGFEGADVITDGWNARILFQSQRVAHTFEHAVYPLHDQLYANEQALQNASGERVVQLEQDRRAMFAELEHHASNILEDQRSMARWGIPASLAGVIRTADLTMTAVGSDLGSAGLVSSLAGLTLSSAAGGARIARAAYRARSLYRQNPDNHDLAKTIREAKTFREVLNAIPRYAELRGETTKPNGRKATDLRIWVSGDKEGAHSIVQVFLTRENPGTWQVEMRVTDLKNETIEVFNNSYRTDLFNDPWRTRKDHNYFWREHPFETPVTFVRGVTTMVDGAIDLASGNLPELLATSEMQQFAAAQATADPAAVDNARRHGPAALIALLSRANAVKRWGSGSGEKRP